MRVLENELRGLLSKRAYEDKVMSASKGRVRLYLQGEVNL